MHYVITYCTIIDKRTAECTEMGLETQYGHYIVNNS